jgi:predicted amidohydrolase
MNRARKAKVDVVHFPECALSGYVSTDFPSFAGYDWVLLKDETQKIMLLAGRLGLWVVLGSTHRLTPGDPRLRNSRAGIRGQAERWVFAWVIWLADIYNSVSCPLRGSNLRVPNGGKGELCGFRSSICSARQLFYS